MYLNFRLLILMRMLRKDKVLYFIKAIFSTNPSISLWVFLFSLLSIAGCKNGSMSSIPDAPPPYPSFPFPQERYNTAQVYGGQNIPTSYVPPYSPSNTVLNPSPNPSFYTPPPAPPPTQPSITQKPVQAFTPSTLNRYNRSAAKETSQYTLEAKADLWALVQNAKGVELEWLKMKAGETATLSYQEDLTITCSSGNELVILDNKGKQIDTNPNSSGISIVRLSPQ
jgi:hypothetical protein